MTTSRAIEYRHAFVMGEVISFDRRTARTSGLRRESSTMRVLLVQMGIA
jgi:hypothetical protein